MHMRGNPFTYGVAEAAAQEPYVQQAIRRVGVEFETTGPPRTGIDPDNALMLAAMYPVVRYVLVNIGLPWLHEAVRYSELWRLRTHNWLTDKYLDMGLDPREAERASKLLRDELEHTTDLGARQAWERVRGTLLKYLEPTPQVDSVERTPDPPSSSK
jgi:hypothetical protein